MLYRTESITARSKDRCRPAPPARVCQGRRRSHSSRHRCRPCPSFTDADVAVGVDCRGDIFPAASKTSSPSAAWSSGAISLDFSILHADVTKDEAALLKQQHITMLYDHVQIPFLLDRAIRIQKSAFHIPIAGMFYFYPLNGAKASLIADPDGDGHEYKPRASIIRETKWVTKRQLICQRHAAHQAAAQRAEVGQEAVGKPLPN